MTPQVGTGSKVADDWLGRHGHDYGSHATHSHEAVLRSKRLSCAEEVLRNTGSVENEAFGYGMRGKTTLEDFKDSTAVPFIKYAKYSSKTKTYKEVWIFPKFSESATNIDNLKNNAKVKDKGLFWTAKMNFLEEVQEDLQEFLGDKEIAATHVCSYKPSPLRETSLKADENNGRPVDRQLREVYKYVLKKGINPSDAYDILNNIRSDRLATATRRLSNTIVIEKNGVRWSYGPIAILMGNPKEKVAKPHEWETANRHEEFRLKTPYQVDEGFYHLSLADQDTLILGPKILLDKYRSRQDIEESVKARFLDIESLSPQQRELFNITTVA